MAEQTFNAGATIEPFKAGDKERTARQADVMNEIINRLNSLLSMTVADNLGKFIYADANVVLQLIDIATLDLNVCMDDPDNPGQKIEKVVTFLVKGAPRDPA